MTAADVQRVAKRLLDPAKMTFLMVGNTKDMMLGDDKHPASIKTLAGRRSQATAAARPADDEAGGG